MLNPLLMAGGALAVGLVGWLGGRVLLGRRDEREQNAKDAALQDAAQAVSRLQDAVARREETLLTRESELGGRERRVMDREASLEESRTRIARRERELEDRQERLFAREQEVEHLLAEARGRLAEEAGLSVEAATERLLEELDQELTTEKARRVRRALEGAREEADRLARDVVLTAIQRLGAEPTTESSVARVALADEMKGRVIGREGRNVRALEAATGCDVIVDDAPGYVLISSFDGVRRETGVRALQRLLEEGRIQPGRIEEVVEEERERLERELEECGSAASAEAGIHDLHPRIHAFLGRLRYRTSYGQNVLRHVVEVAHLCGLMASELGLDLRTARRAGLLHDIGKAVGQEVNGSHHDIAARVLKRLGEEKAVIDAVADHHDASDVLSPYAALVQVADAISAARPGARRENVERFAARIRELETIASGFPGVAQAYAVHAGREVRVLVDAGSVDDDGAARLAFEIARELEADLSYPGEIKVTVIREVRQIEVAK